MTAHTTIATSIVLAIILSACASHPVPPQPAPTLAEILNSSVSGLFEQPITLRDGRWEGEPYAPGGASRPRAGVAGDLLLSGDLDGDGNEDAVAFLWSATGGSGTLNYLAVFERNARGVQNTATVLLGDRVQLRAARIVDGRIEVDVVQHGPNDAACCPGENATRSWMITGDQLIEQEAQIGDRLSVADLEGTEWRLKGNEVVTLTVTEGRVAGWAHCNNYFGSITDGDTPGVITIGPLASTRKACVDETLMGQEQAYLQTLSGVTHFGFVTGTLALTSRADGDVKSLIFEPVGQE